MAKLTGDAKKRFLARMARGRAAAAAKGSPARKRKRKGAGKGRGRRLNAAAGHVSRSGSMTIDQRLDRLEHNDAAMQAVFVGMINQGRQARGQATIKTLVGFSPPVVSLRHKSKVLGSG